MMLCTVADVTGDVAPELWRRYLPMLLDGLREGTLTPLPIGAVDETCCARRCRTHKQRLMRGRRRHQPR